MIKEAMNSKQPENVSSSGKPRKPPSACESCIAKDEVVKCDHCFICGSSEHFAREDLDSDEEVILCFPEDTPRRQSRWPRPPTPFYAPDTNVPLDPDANSATNNVQQPRHEPPNLTKDDVIQQPVENIPEMLNTTPSSPDTSLSTDLGSPPEVSRRPRRVIKPPEYFTYPSLGNPSSFPVVNMLQAPQQLPMYPIPSYRPPFYRPIQQRPTFPVWNIPIGYHY